MLKSSIYLEKTSESKSECDSLSTTTEGQDFPYLIFVYRNLKRPLSSQRVFFGIIQQAFVVSIANKLFSAKELTCLPDTQLMQMCQLCF